MSLFVGSPVEAGGLRAIRPVGNHWLGATSFQPLPQVRAVVGRIADQLGRGLGSSDEARGGRTIVNLAPLRRIERRRPLVSASASIFVLRPPRERPIACFCSPPLCPPEAERCTLTCVLSIIWVSLDRPRSASSPNNLS